MKQLMLGTSKWEDWKNCYKLLDNWPENGLIDTATNYPTNGIDDDFQLSENILHSYMKETGKRFKVNVKIGSLTNNGSPENNLTSRSLFTLADYYLEKFEGNLDCLMIHWDNRDDSFDIAESIAVMENIRDVNSINIGFSGIKHINIYEKVFREFEFRDIRFQVRYDLINNYTNLLINNHLQVYRFYTGSEDYLSSLETAFKNDQIETILIGTRSLKHLIETQQFYGEYCNA